MEAAKIAQIIDEMGTLLELEGENPFRVAARITRPRRRSGTCRATCRT